jgi:Ca2+-binding RTX toxin-like protein
VKPKCTTIATSASPAGSYAIMPGGAVDPDYAFMYRAGTLTIGATSNAVYLMPDPLQAGNILYIWGTTSNDTITVNPGSGASLVSVSMNGVTKGYGSSSQPISRIVAHGLTGADTISVSTAVALPAWVYGDDNDDTLSGGGGPTYLLGGAGNDTLMSSTGRSIMIGGSGGDTLLAGAGQAVLIGGTTLYDANDAALLAVINEWRSSPADTTLLGYQTRAGHITGASGGVNNGYYLKVGTVFNDAAIDRLLGNIAAYDLFFRSAGEMPSGQNAGDLAPISV